MPGNKVADRVAAKMHGAMCCKGRKRPPAPGAIGVGCDDEAILVRHGAAGVAQVPDAPCPGIDQCAGQVVSRRWCEVDPVAEPVDHVEIVPRHARVEQRLRCAAGGDPVEADRGTFQPVAQVRAGDEQPAEPVGKAIEVGDVAEAQRPGGDVCIVSGPAATAGLERGGGREHGKFAMGRVPQRGGKSRPLRVIDKLRGRIVAQQREIAMQRGGRRSDHPLREAPGMGMSAGERFGQGWTGPRVCRRFECGMVISDTPGPCGSGQLQVELTEM
ncbi:MAG TPA: hypothetical protein VKN37_02970 [Roseovarius sp.]|nr:hypothetical protein [Roseovarius sp.]